MLQNYPNIKDLKEMPVGEVVKLSADTLAVLQGQVEADLRQAKQTKDWFDGILSLKYADRLAEVRLDAGKDTGVAAITDGDVTIKGDLPKRVEWHQESLATLHDEIKAGGDNPDEYMSCKFSVAEKAYTSWPSWLRKKFEPARTLKLGKQKITLSTGSAK
jgi:hypothetical protein